MQKMFSQKALNKLKLPLVTVIIPVYNVQKYLPQCIDSVRIQTYDNLDIILVDDGSNDGSEKICDNVAELDSRITVIHTTNKGLSAARNTGIQFAKGTHILFLDSDDWIQPETIDILLKTAIEYDADFVAAKKCDEYVNHIEYLQLTSDPIQVFHGNDILKAYAEEKLGNVAWNKLYRNDCFSQIRFPEGRNFEDLATTWRIVTEVAGKQGTVVVLSIVLFHFRMRYSSISHTKSAKNIFDLWKSQYERFEVMEQYQKEFLPYCFIPIRWMWACYDGFSKEDKIKYNNTIREMRAFSKTHFQETIHGRYSILTKLTCFLSTSNLKLLMKCCYIVNTHFLLQKQDKRIMYD